MKRLILISLLFLGVSTYAQDKPKKEATKEEVLYSKTGAIVKMERVPFNNLPVSQGECKGYIKILTITSESHYFYWIDYADGIRISSASIEYSDLVEVNKALRQLKATEPRDLRTPNYIENSFQTADGFKIGYYVQEGRSIWYMELEKGGSRTTVYLKDVTGIETSFLEAERMIEETKKMGIFGK
jgi:hypothetical protein